MCQTLNITVIERAAGDGQWRFEQASLHSPEEAIRHWLRKVATSAPIAHPSGSDVYVPETRSRPPVRARRCRVIVPGVQPRSLGWRLVVGLAGLIADLLRLVVFRSWRLAHARHRSSRPRRR